MKTAVGFIFCFIFFAGCKDAYNPPVGSPPSGYLVVEGFINNGTEPTSITLSRTTPVYDTAQVVYEDNAQVAIEGSNNDSYALAETGTGVYTSQTLLLNSTEQYRLHIHTADGKEYVSDYTPVKTTPPIDSISWLRDGDGVHIFINTHDALNNTKYYQWQDEETWEFHSAFHTMLTYVTTQLPGDVIYSVDYRLPSHEQDTSIYKCWHSPHSTSILLGSSEKLSEDKIDQNLINIASGAQQLSVLYSIKINQHAVSKNNYEFLQKMKKNTEQIGSIFDAQPSQIKGNIHCVSSPTEQVIGFMEVSQLQSQRIFISNAQVPGWGYAQACGETEILNTSDNIKKYGIGLMPTSVAQFQLGIVSFYASDPYCVDCTLTGSNARPDFWP